MNSQGTRKSRSSDASAKVKKCWEAARRAELDHDHEKALTLYEQARDEEPTHPDVLLRLGRAYAQQYRYRETEAVFRDLFRLPGVTPAMVFQAGVVWQENNRPDWAGHLFRLAAKKAPLNVQPLLELGTLEERRHRLPAARRAVREALRRDPRSQDARCLAAHVARRSGDPEEGERILRKLLGEEMASATAHWRGWHYLGQILDKQGRYEEAMEAFVSGKKILRANARLHKQNFAREKKVLQQMAADLDPGQLKAWQAEAGEHGLREKAGHVCWLGGPPRSGTTLVAAVLGAHPGVLAADECIAFGPEVSDPIIRLSKQRGNMDLLRLLDEVPADTRGHLADNYQQRMERWLDEPLRKRLLLDKNPALTPSMPMAARILPGMRFLVMRRDPRDIAISCFMQALPLNNISVNFLHLDSTARYVAFSLDAWRRFRDRADQRQWLEIPYEKLVRDLPGESRRILDFLDLPWKRRLLRFHEAARKAPFLSPTYADVTHPVYTKAIGRWENYARYLEPYLGILKEPD